METTQSMTKEMERKRIICRLSRQFRLCNCCYYEAQSMNSDLQAVHYMVTKVQEEFPYFTPGTLSGKQKRGLFRS